MTHRRPPLALVGVTHLTDLYPNVKYKVAMLKKAAHPLRQLYDLGDGSLAQASIRPGVGARITFTLRLLWAHMIVFTKTMLRPSAAAYLPYPAVPTLLFYSFWPKRQRPHLVADAFISVYDTVVVDRRLITQAHWLARILFLLERRAYQTADVVLVDTRENGAYYAELFRLPSEHFVELPLSVPPLATLPTKASEQSRFHCLFMGSMVPLQGIMTILEAARLLEETPAIEFTIIGTGQQATLVENFLIANPRLRVNWIREIVSAERLRDEIKEADLCLGIFGDSAKADRVLPYKLYYYALLGRPFLTRRSTTLQRIADPALLCDNSAAALAARIETLSQDATQLATCGAASQALGRSIGNQEQIGARLSKLLQQP